MSGASPGESVSRRGVARLRGAGEPAASPGRSAGTIRVWAEAAPPHREAPAPDPQGTRFGSCHGRGAGGPRSKPRSPGPIAASQHPHPPCAGSRGCWRSHQRAWAALTAGECFSPMTLAVRLWPVHGVPSCPRLVTSGCPYGLLGALVLVRSHGAGSRTDATVAHAAKTGAARHLPQDRLALSMTFLARHPPLAPPSPSPLPHPHAPHPVPTFLFFCPQASPKPSSCPTPGPPCHPPKRWSSLIPLSSPALAGCGLFNKCLIATVKDQLGMTGDFCSGTWAVLRVSNKMHLGRTTEMQGSWGPLEAPLA